MNKIEIQLDRIYAMNTELGQAINIINYAVNTFNAISDVEKDTWREHLRFIIDVHKDDFENRGVKLNYGFSGSHFWLHDFANKRVLIVVETNH